MPTAVHERHSSHPAASSLASSFRAPRSFFFNDDEDDDVEEKRRPTRWDFRGAERRRTWMAIGGTLLLFVFLYTRFPTEGSSLGESNQAPAEIEGMIPEIDVHVPEPYARVSQPTEAVETQWVEPVAAEVEPEPSAKRTNGKVTILTGTHLSNAHINPPAPSPACAKLAESLHGMWAAWEVKDYAAAKNAVREALRRLTPSEECVLSGYQDTLWTFPMARKPSTPCDERTQNYLTTKSYLREKTKVYVNWFLLRPDLVVFHNMASVEGVAVHYLVYGGTDVGSAAMFKESGCPRFQTVLDKREVYKQRMLLVALSDVQVQLDKLESNTYDFQSCDVALEPGMFPCVSPKSTARITDKTHMGSMLALSLFHAKGQRPERIPKTVFKGPRLVFVAGLEGVGHHLFSLLGRLHTTRELYEALTEYLTDSAWDDNSVVKSQLARAKLVAAMGTISRAKQVDDSNVFFLNTVWVERDVNMYSFPWGGPRCYLKRYGRILCNIDLIELVRAAEEAQVDFRVVHLNRAIGAAVVSASLHRPFGTLVSETRMLAMSSALLKAGLDAIDPAFVIDLNYEDMINHPKETAKALGDHLGLPAVHAMRTHFEATLEESNRNHPVGDGSKWKQEVDLMQMQFMSDILGL